MAITMTLQSVLNFCSTHADLLPLSSVGGFSNEPGLSMCNDAVSEIINTEQDWKFNSVELGATSQPLITVANKQDYLFAGASAFVLSVSGTQSSGAAIDLTSNSGIAVSVGVVTVTTLETHRFKVGAKVNLLGLTFTTGTASKYNATFSDDGSSSSWSTGFTITAVTDKTFSFAAVTGQNNGDVGGAPGINNFGWLSGASQMELNNTTSPPNIKQLKAVRDLPNWSKVSQPEKVAVVQDLQNGIVKVRFSYVPGTTVWAVNLIYQASAPMYTALSQTWSPIPDNYNALVRQAVIYRMYRYLNSAQTTPEYQKLQLMIAKAQGRDSVEESNVYVVPEESLVDDGGFGSL